MVMITKAWPRARIATSPRIAASTAAATPPRGASRNGETSKCLERMPTVYAPTPMNALWPSET